MTRSRVRPGRLAVPLLLLAAAPALSCAPDGDSVVLVHVGVAGTVPDVFQLRATLSNAGNSEPAAFPDQPAAARINFPTDFSVTLPRARSGSLDIALDGLGVQGVMVVANGAVRTTIARSRLTEVSIQLTAGASLCGNNRLDSGEECDDGDRVSNGTCDFQCHMIVTGAGGSSGGGTGGASGIGGGGAGGSAGTGGLPGGTGGTIGTGGRGAGGSFGTGGTIGTGGIIGTGGRGVGGMGVGGMGVGGTAGACSLELLPADPYFNNPNAWVSTSSLNQRLIVDQTEVEAGGVVPASPPNIASLGRNLLPGGEETLSRTVTIPGAATRLLLQGFFNIQLDINGTVCLNCNPGFIEFIESGALIPAISWNSSNATPDNLMRGFNASPDITLLRGKTVTFRMRVTPTSTPPARYYFDNLSLQVDRCQ